MQIINPNYSALNAEQTAAIALNTTHRTSDGKNHADVVTNTAGIATNVTAIGLNTTHRGSDGSGHADVASNSAARHTQGTDTTLGTMTGSIAMGGYNITGAGIISGGLDIIDIGEDTILTPAQCLSAICLVS